MLQYKLLYPKEIVSPIVLSVPHCGTAFPEELINQFDPELRNAPDDTDWFVHDLYRFAIDMGIPMIYATYSRWVIDLNRDPESKPLYTDGRIITALCPVTDFFGNTIYIDQRDRVDDAEVQRRRKLYYDPYHHQLQRLLDEVKNKFGNVLLWDCHSIRQSVPTIHKEKFPDLILGDADGTSASPIVSEVAIQSLGQTSYSFRYNYPFKGGYITRSFGKPLENQHALQLEMTKVNYMNDAELKYDEIRAAKIQRLLRDTFSRLSELLLKKV